MQSSTDISLDSTFPAAAESRRGALVQDRPTLGSLPRASRGLGWWLPPAVDLVSSSVALTAITLIAGVGVFPALPIAPLLLLALNGLLGVYGANASTAGLGSEDGMAWPVIRLLMAAVFAWSASLITPLDGGSQLALWVTFAVLDTAGRALSAPLLGRLDEGRALGPRRRRGDRRTAQRLRAAAPLRQRRLHRGALRGPLQPGRSRRRPGDRRPLPGRPRRDRLQARRRREPARPRPRLQVDRRAGQPAAPPARPARGARDDAEQGWRRAADRGRGARRPPTPSPTPAPTAAAPQDQGQRRRAGDERGEEHRPRAQAASRGPARGDPRRRQLRGRHDRGRPLGLPRDPRPGPERPRQGRCLPHRLRRRHRQPRGHARRRRLRRPGRDPPLRRSARGRRRLRQGLALPARRRQHRHHRPAQPRQQHASAAPPTSCTAPTSPTSATATTPSGPAACPSSRSTSRASRSRP